MPSLLAAVLLLLAPAAAAQAPGGEIPQEPDSDPAPEFSGAAATPKPVYAPQPPRHPFMAPNGRSNIHSDAYMTDTNAWAGPLGRDSETTSSFQTGANCASVTFDSRGRIVTICVGIQRPRLKLLDPRTLAELATMDLPPRDPATFPTIFSDFSGGGYFYLDQRDRAVIPTNDRHLLVVAHREGEGFVVERDHDLTGVIPEGKLISAIPDWSGRIWVASTNGIVVTVDPGTGALRSLDTGEVIQNSFTAGDEQEIYIVSERALYRFEAGADGTPRAAWRRVYPNSGVRKPGQVSAGSGTTPTLHGAGWVSITDNADPMNVIVYRRADGAELCRQPVFERGASATDNSLIGAGHSIVVENNYGYTGPGSTLQGARTTPGVERVDVDADGRGCRRVWRSEETSPTVVPKLSLAGGLVYVYTQGPAGDDDDPWYLTALDFRSGKTVWKRLTGQGLGFNNNYAPVTIGPDGTAYVGVLGGLALVRDREPPAQTTPTAPAIALRVSPRRVAAERRVRLRFSASAPSGGVIAPVAGARVRIGKRVAYTRSDGRATIALRFGKAARYRPRASKPGHRAGRAALTVTRAR